MAEYLIGVVCGAIATGLCMFIFKSIKDFEKDYNYLVDRVNSYETYIDSQKERITQLENIIDNK